MKITYLSPLLLLSGCFDPSAPEAILTAENTVVLHVASQPLSLENPVAGSQIPLDLNGFPSSRFGAQFQSPVQYHPIHNNSSSPDAEPLPREIAAPALLLVQELSRISREQPSKNLLLMFSDDQDSSRGPEKLALQNGTRISQFADLVFFARKNAKTSPSIMSGMFQRLAAESGCTPASAAVLTPRGIQKIRHLLDTVHEDPGKQLSRYLGLNLRTFCMREGVNNPHYVYQVPEKPRFTDRVDIDSDVKTYVLNLDRSPQRFINMVEWLSAADVSFSRFSAIDGKHPSFNLDDLISQGLVGGWFDPKLPYHPIHQMGKDVDLTHDDLLGGGHSGTQEIKYSCVGPNWSSDCVKKLLSNRTIATGLSHVKMMTDHFAKYPDHHGLFFEDDVKLPRGMKPSEFKTRFNKTMSELPDNWDIIYLDYHDPACLKTELSLELAQYAAGRTCVPGDFAMLVNKRSAKKIIALMTPLMEESDRQLMKYFGTVVQAYWVRSSLVRVDLEGSSDRKSTDKETGSN